MATKVCSKCRQDKDLSDFYISRSSRDGYQSYCIDCTLRRTRKAKQSTADRVYWARLETIYGIDKFKYEVMLLQQDGKCAICKRAPDRRLGVDHCHKSGKIRQLLCNTCNAGLGNFHDDIELLKLATQYLIKHQ